MGRKEKKDRKEKERKEYRKEKKRNIGKKRKGKKRNIGKERKGKEINNNLVKNRQLPFYSKSQLFLEGHPTLIPSNARLKRWPVLSGMTPSQCYQIYK